jgi:hypothetical protein
MNFSFSEPIIKRVRRGTGYRVEGFARTGEEGRTICREPMICIVR